MTYLLDTHTFVWVMIYPERIPGKIKEIIQDAENHVLISVVSFWEIAIKFGLGKLQLTGVTPDDLPKFAEENKFSILALPSLDASTIHRLVWKDKHRDPFDRMLIWQAIQNNLTIISADSDFGQYRDAGLKLIW